MTKVVEVIKVCATHGYCAPPDRPFGTGPSFREPSGFRAGGVAVGLKFAVNCRINAKTNMTISAYSLQQPKQRT